jgi:hypothetical protein
VSDRWGRAVALGVVALAAKKNETFTFVHVSDKNTVWRFAINAPQGKVLAAMRPVLVAFINRAVTGPQPLQPVPQAAPNVPSTPWVADKLAKLAKLKVDGVLQEVTDRLPCRLDPTTTSFNSAGDLAAALQRAESAHAEHEKRIGRADSDWPAWYAECMVREQRGQELPV